MRVSENAYFEKSLGAAIFILSAGCVSDNHIAAGANIATSKMLHRHVVHYKQVDGEDVADTTGDGIPIHICRKATTIIAAEITLVDAVPAGKTGKVEVDIKYANDTPTAATTILTAVITHDHTNADYEIVAGELAVTALAIGDVILACVAETDGDGDHPQGLNVTLTLDEAP